MTLPLASNTAYCATAHTRDPLYIIYILPCMLIIRLVLSGCQISICSLFRLFALYLAPAASALQLLKSGTLHQTLQMCTSSNTSRHHLKTHYSSRPQIQHLLTTVRVCHLNLLTYDRNVHYYSKQDILLLSLHASFLLAALNDFPMRIQQSDAATNANYYVIICQKLMER